MTGKSKWSEACQRNTVEGIMGGIAIDTAIKVLNPSPVKKTIQRWIDNWEPIITKEFDERQRRQNQTRTDKIRHDKKKVRQDENYLKIPSIFLSVVEAIAYNWLESYKNKSNPAAIRRRAKVKKIIKILEKEVDK